MTQNNLMDILNSKTDLSSSSISGEFLTTNKFKSDYHEYLAHNQSLLAEISSIDSIPLPRVKIFKELDNSNLEEFILEKEIPVIINDNLKLLSTSMLILMFEDSSLNKVLSNKNVLFVRYSINPQFYIDQFITSRMIDIQGTYILNDDIHITFLQWQEKISKLKALSSSTGSKIKLELDLNVKLDLNKELEENLVYSLFSHLSNKELESCSTYKDVWLILTQAEKQTIDLNYIKLLNYVSKLVYQSHQKIINQGGN